MKIFKGARDFFPVARHVGRVTYLKLVELMSGENTTLSSTDILAVTNLEGKTVVKQVLDGKSVTTSLGTFRVVPKGHSHPPGTNGAEASEIRWEWHFAPAPWVVKATAEAEQMRVPSGSTDRPWPQYLKDLTTQTANVLVTPGGDGEVFGERLKFDSSDPRQGLFLVAAGPGGTALRAEVRGTMSQSYVPLRFPAELLPDTVYHVEMRTQFEGDTSDRLRIEALAWSVTARAA
ncbi:MAG: DUF4469 domain-containing protein [Candidatus Limnocylindria bacterium]